jgi:cytochrome c biogenesis protein CcdA
MFLKEKFHWHRFIGTLIVVLGIFFLLFFLTSFLKKNLPFYGRMTYCFVRGLITFFSPTILASYPGKP